MKTDLAMKSIALGLCVLALSSVGCIDYEERLELNADGKTGLLKMHLAVDERFVALDWPKYEGGTGVEKVFPTTLEDLRKEIDCEALELTDARASAIAPMRHLFVICRIKDVDKLDESPAMSHRKFLLKRDEGGDWKVEQTININAGSVLGGEANETRGMLGQLEKNYGADTIRNALGNYSLRMSVTVPEGFKTRAPGGKVHRERTVMWSRSLSQLLYSKETWKMEADFVRDK